MNRRVLYCLCAAMILLASRTAETIREGSVSDVAMFAPWVMVCAACLLWRDAK